MLLDAFHICVMNSPVIGCLL